MTMTLLDLKTYINDVPDFPQKGVVFKDISPLLASAKARKTTTELLSKPYLDKKIDVVIGVESRGFLLSSAIANELNAAFVMVRKPGKLPGVVISQEYALEYGKDTLEIQKTAIKKGDRVLIHDDVLATGGTAQAVKLLVEQCGGTVVGFNFLIALDFLNGATKIDAHDMFSLLHY